MKKIVFICAVMLVPYSFANECNTDEILVASCNLSGEIQRSALFCAKKNNDKIRYSFKRGNVSELVVEFNSQNKLKRWVDLGTYSTYLGFNKGEYSYVLIVPEERSGAVALLEVSRNGEKINTRRCESNSFGEQHLKKNSIQDVLDETVRNNGFKFP